MVFDSPVSRLVLAVDMADRSAAERLIAHTRDTVGVVKIGLELAMAGGLDLARDVSADGVAVFLDIKLLDIGNTVTAATRAAGALGVRFLTVHAYPQALNAAMAGAPDGLTVVAVTVLTSMDERDMVETGYATGPRALVNRRLAQARALGVTTAVCSPHEARAAAALGLAPITPGVRLPDDDAGDQKRVATPQAAIASGAEAIVVGRPIHAAADAAAAARAYVHAIEEGLAARPR